MSKPHSSDAALARASVTPPYASVLTEVKKPTTQSWEHAWVGMEPTFSTKKAVRLFHKHAATEKDETEFFYHPYMQGTAKDVVKAIVKKYRAAQARGESWCLFAEVERERDEDQWGVPRHCARFRSAGCHETFAVRLGLDPETFEFSIKPVPLVWLYDPRFVRLLQECVFDVPLSLGLRPSVVVGGAQFSVSAKTYLSGSLLADDIADKWNSPELSTWMLDYPNVDDRSFRATARRRRAFERIFADYWAGAFHPRAKGVPTVENAYRDFGFDPMPSPPPGLMTEQGPVGSADEIFQNNFVFARALRWRAQNVHPGYWQSANPISEGYRPDQIMRYSEGNLNRLRIASERHVKSGKVLDPQRIPRFEAPLALEMLYDEASWENRGQMGRTSAQDYVEAILLDIHRARYLQAHPHVRLRSSLLQDQLHGEAEDTLRRLGQTALLDALQQQAERDNYEDSEHSIRSSFIEPETLFWAAWRALPVGEKAAIAREAIGSFVERVHAAASCDPRRQAPDSDCDPDPMEWHRHRVQPLLWHALEAGGATGDPSDPVTREYLLWKSDPEKYLTRRPIWSVDPATRLPWE